MHANQSYHYHSLVGACAVCDNSVAWQMKLNDAMQCVFPGLKLAKSSSCYCDRILRLYVAGTTSTKMLI